MQVDFAPKDAADGQQPPQHGTAFIAEANGVYYAITARHNIRLDGRDNDEMEQNWNVSAYLYHCSGYNPSIYFPIDSINWDLIPNDQTQSDVDIAILQIVGGIGLDTLKAHSFSLASPPSGLDTFDVTVNGYPDFDGPIDGGRTLLKNNDTSMVLDLDSNYLEGYSGSPIILDGQAIGVLIRNSLAAPKSKAVMFRGAAHDYLDDRGFNIGPKQGRIVRNELSIKRVLVYITFDSGISGTLESLIGGSVVPKVEALLKDMLGGLPVAVHVKVESATVDGAPLNDSGAYSDLLRDDLDARRTILEGYSFDDIAIYRAEVLLRSPDGHITFETTPIIKSDGVVEIHDPFGGPQPFRIIDDPSDSRSVEYVVRLAQQSSFIVRDITQRQILNVPPNRVFIDCVYYGSGEKNELDWAAWHLAKTFSSPTHVGNWNVVEWLPAARHRCEELDYPQNFLHRAIGENTKFPRYILQAELHKTFLGALKLSIGRGEVWSENGFQPAFEPKDLDGICIDANVCEETVSETEFLEQLFEHMKTAAEPLRREQE